MLYEVITDDARGALQFHDGMHRSATGTVPAFRPPYLQRVGCDLFSQSAEEDLQGSGRTEGTTQNDRFLEALNPDSVLIQDFSTQDWT